MQHVIAVLALGILCLAWAVVQRLSDGRACTGTCDGCINKIIDAQAAAAKSGGAEGAPALPARRPCWKRRLKLALALLLGLGLGGWAAWRLLGPPSRGATAPVTLTRPLMGTLWTIQVVPPPSRTPASVVDAIDAAFDEVARVESVMSEWRPETPISAVNAAAGGEPVAVPEELRRIIERGIAWGRRSDGAFDITWRGMGRLWKFSDEEFTVPSPEAIEEARRRVDYRRIVIDGDRVGLPEPGMALGLGGIAKGYGVDRAARVLLDRGLTSFSVAGAGDIRLQGTNPEGEPWRVGVRDPRGGPQDLIATLHLTGGAVSTSGDYERFREVDGVRYHHVIDPRTGRPARGCRSVTIVAPENETADALATAVFVLGPEQGLALVSQVPGAEALVVDADGATHVSPSWKRGREPFISPHLERASPKATGAT